MSVLLGTSLFTRTFIYSANNELENALCYDIFGLKTNHALFIFRIISFYILRKLFSLNSVLQRGHISQQ